MKIVDFTTVNATIFRTLFETLKEQLFEFDLVFTREGIEINNTTSQNNGIIFLKLNSEEFEEYVCQRDTFSIGLNILEFYKIIKTCSDGSSLRIYYDDDEEGKLNIQMENKEDNLKKSYKLNLMDTNRQSINLDGSVVLTKTLIPTTIFQKIIKDMKTFSDRVDITIQNETLSFSCDGEFTTQETELTQGVSESSLLFQTKTQEKHTGCFMVESLIKIIKCSNLCQKLKLSFLEKNQKVFMMLEYDVGNLGQVQFILMKMEEEEY